MRRQIFARVDKKNDFVRNFRAPGEIFFSARQTIPTA
jgi:hypothetical protein